MSIVVQENQNKFTKIANVLITAPNLSAGAKILYCYLRSKPDNWKVINADIIKNLQVSQETLAKNFKELLVAGWITREKEKDSKGHILGGYIYHLYDLPQTPKEQPNTEETRIQEKPVYGKNLDTKKNHIRKKPLNINNTKTTSKTNTTSNTKTTILPVAKKKVLTPQGKIGEFFKAKYKALTGIDYLMTDAEYIILAGLLKEYSEDLICQRIEWLEIGCKQSVFWFAKNISDFTIFTLKKHWNRIVPILTEEQKKAQAEQKKEEERMKRVLAEAQKLREERSK